MLRKIITGGQTGVEQAAWASAKRAGLATGGYMPARFATDDGPSARLGQSFGAVEFPFDDTRRARANARHATGVLWLGTPDSPAGRLTIAAAGAEGKPFLVVQPDRRPPADVVAWIDVFEIEVLMVAGDPASQAPDVARLAGTFLDRVFAASAIRSGRPSRP